MSSLPAWHDECSDELNAVMMKYMAIAKAEGYSASSLGMSFKAMFANRLHAFTPSGAEKRVIVLMGDLFDEFRPGWRQK